MQSLQIWNLSMHYVSNFDILYSSYHIIIYLLQLILMMSWFCRYKFCCSSCVCFHGKFKRYCHRTGSCGVSLAWKPAFRGDQWLQKSWISCSCFYFHFLCRSRSNGTWSFKVNYSTTINAWFLSLCMLWLIFFTSFCRLGFLIDFLSHAAIVGFMAGAAITIALQQLKGLLGIKAFTKKTDIVSVMTSVFKAAHHGVSLHFLLKSSFSILSLCETIYELFSAYFHKLFRMTYESSLYENKYTLFYLLL